MSRNAFSEAVAAVLPSNESPPLSKKVCCTHGVTHATRYTSIAWKSVIIGMIILLVYGLSGIASPSAHATNPDARPHVPENWQWGSGTVDMVLQNRHSLPHVDDDTCRPSERRPNPVILLHGTGGTGADFVSHAAALVNDGYCVWAPTYGKGLTIGGHTFVGGTTSIEHGAALELSGLIDHVLAVTGARKVDLVGVSLGGVVATYTTKVHRPDKVDRVVGIATYWGLGEIMPDMGPLTAAFQGSADFSPFVAMRELQPGSPFHQRWLGESGSPFVPGVDYTAITSDADGLIPGNLSYVPGRGLRHIRLQDGCSVNRSSHLTQINDPRAVDAVMSALDPFDIRPLRCIPTDGLIGPIGPVPPR